mmetsp:Transcript_8412/g.31679  ORF Transcript_8412/g.31679 Transcript_8412/m.31679 type:complete len:268 (+) Transcript_8412:305-1108(+)
MRPRTSRRGSSRLWPRARPPLPSSTATKPWSSLARCRAATTSSLSLMRWTIPTLPPWRRKRSARRCLFSMRSMTSMKRPRPATRTQRRSCSPGQTRAGSCQSPRFRRRSRSQSSRCRERPTRMTSALPRMPGLALISPCTPRRCSRTRETASRRTTTGTSVRSRRSTSSRRRASRLPTSAMWSEPAPAASRQRTPSSGTSATTFLSSRTSASAASASAPRLPRFSTTPWRTPAPCPSRCPSATSAWATSSTSTRTRARSASKAPTRS